MKIFYKRDLLRGGGGTVQGGVGELVWYTTNWTTNPRVAGLIPCFAIFSDETVNHDLIHDLFCLANW